MSNGGVDPATIYSQLQQQITSLGTSLDKTREALVKAAVSKEILERVEKKVTDIDESLHGNGGVGLVVRVDRLEKQAGDNNPNRSSTQAMEAVKVQWLKWTTIKWIADKAWKVAVVLILLSMGYREVAKPLLGIPPNKPAPIHDTQK